MIGIRIENIILDIEPSTKTQFQQSSPFFDENQIQGEYSLPIELKATEKNLRALGYINELQVIKESVKINTVAYLENGLPLYTGTLVTEYAACSFNHGGGTISAYFICGVSNFWQKIKDKKMKDLELGGKREFLSDYDDPEPGGIRYEVQASLTATSDTMDYVFAPVINDGWGDGGGWMNMPLVVSADGINGNTEIAFPTGLHGQENRRSLVPMPYVGYVMKKVFEEHGYKLTGDILSDDDFKKIIMPNMQAMSIFQSHSEWTGDHRIFIKEAPYIDLATNMPDMTVAEFIISIRNKLGIGYEFNNAQHTCEIITLRDVAKKSARKNFNEKVSSNYKLNFQEKKTFSLTQEFDSNDQAVENPDFSNVTIKGTVSNIDALPALDDPNAEINEGDCYLCLQENQYYSFQYDEDSDSFLWAFYADNIYDYKVDNSNEDISTKATSMGMQQLPWTAISGSWAMPGKNYWPYCNQEGNWKGKQGNYATFGLRLMFYHGMQIEDRNGLNITFPFTSNSNYYRENKIGDWSLSYQAGEDGLLPVFWQNWMKTLGGNEVLEATLYPALHEFMNLKWSDIILIRNVPWLITDKTVNSPYDGSIAIKAMRMNSLGVRASTAPAPTCPDCIVPDGLSAVVNADNTVTFTFNSVRHYDYLLQWSKDNFVTIAGTKVITNAGTTGAFSTTTGILPKNGETYQWRVQHIHCGGTCNESGAWANGNDFTVATSEITVTFNVYKDSVDTRLVNASITLSEPVDRDIYMHGKAYLDYHDGRTGRMLWYLTIPAGQTFAFRHQISGAYDDTVISFCYDTISPKTASGKSLKVIGTHC